MEGFDNLQQGEDDFPLSLLYFSDTFALKSKWSGMKRSGIWINSQKSKRQMRETREELLRNPTQASLVLGTKHLKLAPAEECPLS